MNARTITYTSGLSAKGALLEETLVVMRHMAQGATVSQVRAMVMDDDLLGKNTVATRASVWKRIQARYLSDAAHARTIAAMVTQAPDRQTERLVLFYEFCQATPILRDVTVGCVYPHYAAGFINVDKALIQQYLDDIAGDHPEVTAWSPQTRGKVVSNILAVLRDFGLLAGKVHKQFTPLYVPLPAFVYGLYRMVQEGDTTPQAIIQARDWRLFLLEEQEVIALLDEASAAGHCTFKHQGDIYTLDLAYASLEACVAALTA